MSKYQIAAAIYEESKDMDFLDYDDTKEQSISFILGLLESIGESATRAFFDNI